MTYWSTSTIRPPTSYTNPLKLTHMQQYGDTVNDPSAACMLSSKNKVCYEEDHLISLENGGDPRDPRNLWPEPYKTQVGVFAMAECAYCKTETELHESGLPVCPSCSDARAKRKPPATDHQVRSTLLQDVIELTARTEEAIKEFEAVTGKIPSNLPHPDGVQRIKNASNKLSTARNELMKAHRRLNEHIETVMCRTI